MYEVIKNTYLKDGYENIVEYKATTSTLNSLYKYLDIDARNPRDFYEAKRNLLICAAITVLLDLAFYVGTATLVYNIFKSVEVIETLKYAILLAFWAYIFLEKE